jgi:hypothetical protein
MSIAVPSGTAAPDTPAAPPKEISRPLVWLLAILALGLALRVGHGHGAPFEVDEFTVLAAVAERTGVEPGTTPTAQDPLVPVAGLGEVGNRSVIPFGIQDPVPLYHDFLWAVLHVLPVAEWSVRLPSMLAGVACIAVVFFLLRKPFGNEMALVAAAFVALDPIQINASWLARPFALANLFTVLSFAAVLGVLHARTTAKAALCALGYAACVALIGYLDALMLLVVVAHIGMVVYAVRDAEDGSARKAAGYWAAGLALGLVLLAPEFGYYFRVSSWAVDHSRYLTAANDIHIFTPFKTLIKQNLTLLAGLALVLGAGALVRMQLQGGGAAEGEGEGGAPAAGSPGEDGAPQALTEAPSAGTAVAPAPAATAAPPEPAAPLPENDEALRMARLWVFVPQAALLLVSLLVASAFVTRNMTYTTLGAAILLAYYATRDGSREVRLGIAGAVAVGMLLIGFWPDYSAGQGLFSSGHAKGIMGTPETKGGLAGTDMASIWKPNDVVLMRSGLFEADFLRTEIPEATRPQVERAMLAPLTLLYPDSSHKRVIALTFSEYRNKKAKTPAGELVNLGAFYDDAFARQLKPYNRYWVTGVGPTAAPNSAAYLSGLVPWMADHLEPIDLRPAQLLAAQPIAAPGAPLGAVTQNVVECQLATSDDFVVRTLLLSTERPKDSPDHYVTVKPGLSPDEPIKGLTEGVLEKDFSNPLHIVRRPNLQ